MINKIKQLIGLGLFLACTITEQAIFAKDSDSSSRVDSMVEGELLIKFRSSVEDFASKSLLKRYGGTVVQIYESLPGIAHVRFSEKVALEDVHKALEESELVEAVSYNYIRHARLILDDPLVGVGAQWGIQNTGQLGGQEGADIDAFAAWDTRTDASGIIVAIIDTGVRYTHEDLAANMWVNPGEIPANGIDDDGNGYVDDIHGINAAIDSGDPMDDQGHGTHVAGILGADGNNGIGVSGVAWKVKIMALKFLDSEGDGTDADAIKCIDYAISNGARVINNSWGGYSYNPLLEIAIQEANTAGIYYVAAAGNISSDNDDIPNYPASYDVENIISVTATDRHDQLAKFASFGERTVDLAAPGVSVYSTYFEDDQDYRQMNGTSMAAPHVSGAIALLLSEFPSESMAEILNRLYSSVYHLEGLAGRCVTGGRLNLRLALRPEVQPPLNDDFSNATQLFRRSTSFNKEASSESDEPRHVSVDSGNSVWWKWLPSTDGLVKVATARTIEKSDNDRKRLINISTRGAVSTGANVLISGFVVEGKKNVKLLIQGVGPELKLDRDRLIFLAQRGQSGLPRILPHSVKVRTSIDPEIRVFKGDMLIAQNDDWTDSSPFSPIRFEILDMIEKVGSTPLLFLSGSSAIVREFEPGAYTVVLSNRKGIEGIALIEIYRVPEE